MAEKTKAIAIKEQTIDAVAHRIAKLQNQGEIHFPADYSPQNALKQAWLTLQEVKDKNGNLALQTCTTPSIMNAVMDMVIQGLNPAKKQVYFIAYGNQLTCQRSYFGSMALAKRVNPEIADIVAEVVFEGDEFEYEIDRGKKFVTRHKQTLKSVDSNKVIGAYCVMYGHDGDALKTDIMTYKEIEKSWKKSKMNPVQNGGLKAGSTHAEYLAEMCRKTVINRCCKAVINASSDKALLGAINRSEFVEAEERAQETVEENANQTVIDIEPEPEPEMDEADQILAEIEDSEEPQAAAGPGF